MGGISPVDVDVWCIVLVVIYHRLIFIPFSLLTAIRCLLTSTRICRIFLIFPKRQFFLDLD